MTLRPEISIVGSGNVAWHLGPALDNAGFIVKEIYGRDQEHAKQLAQRLYQAEILPSLDFSSSNSSIIFLVVTDDAIQEVCQEIILPDNVLLVHTSGAKGLDILEFSAASSSGVFYPLQTFSKSRPVDFKHIPICIEADNSDGESMLIQIGQSLSNKVIPLSSGQRKKIHLAAVFACNFINHMLSISSDIMNKNDLDFDLLKPLVVETVDKALTNDPINMQTGPAIRNDLKTIEMHSNLLHDEEGFQKVYRLITQHIMDYYDL